MHPIMNRRKAIQSVVAGTAAVVASPMAQAAEKELAVFIGHWDKAKALTLQVAEAMPEDGYGSKAKPEMREYGKLMQHIATNNIFYISRFAGGVPDSPKAPDDFDKESTRKYLTASFDYCAGVLKGMSEKDLDKMYPGRPNAPAQTGWEWILYAFIHTAHHRGYAEVYLREKNIVPPRYAV